MEKFKRLVAMLLCFAMCMSMVPAEAFAAAMDETVAAEELVCTDHDCEETLVIDPISNGETVPTPEGEETLAPVPTEAVEELGENLSAVSPMASCSHSYT